jgi:hypothetical protein|mmetsp:Transcript_1145/g.4510  ORF Transcript_1145/g.4510 Transcript_1145/m.4510 type:complete len:225 (-) Transcript_1145:2203-2877(-)
MPAVTLVAANAVALRADARGASARSRRNRATTRPRGCVPRFVATASTEADDASDTGAVSRRVVGAASLLTSLLSSPAPALATPPRATFQVAESDFKPLPGTKPPIMYADIKGGGGGTEGGAKDGSRVAVHFDVKFRRITVATSRQGAGVTGGTPYGFTVGVPAGTPGGPFISCLNEGIKGMGPGQFRRLIVPPEYAYGANQVQEIPPNATLTVDVELLSIAARA